jgi:hypothetical protein
MAKPKIPKGRDGPTPSQGPDQDGEKPRHNSDGREHQVHQEILERRMRGGPELTPEAYERALEEWRSLQGSVMRPPTDVKGPTDKEEPSTRKENQDQRPKSDSNSE